ncbi:C40 family peptidase [Nonomuraea sp. NPDC003560]|uniref:C40 family peptidase n=1 Tax=Nonomuraea sp. NPDC003560 TaxID=3364341 RepID=UPI003675E322
MKSVRMASLALVAIAVTEALAPLHSMAAVASLDSASISTSSHTSDSSRSLAISAAVARAARDAARTRIGSPYRLGSKGPREFDCSGLVYWAYRRAGASTSRLVEDQRNETRTIARAQLKAGDLIFYESHVAIYNGGDTMIEALNFSTKVRETSIRPRVEKYGTYR